MYGSEKLPINLFSDIREAVQTHVYKVFDPRIVRKLASENKVANVCSVLFALFLRFLADEHATARKVAFPEAGVTVANPVVLGKPMKEGLLQMDDCKGNIPNNLRRTLFEDLYSGGNAPVYFRIANPSGKLSRPFFAIKTPKHDAWIEKERARFRPRQYIVDWPLLPTKAKRGDYKQRSELKEEDYDLYHELLQEELQALAFLTAIVLLDNEWRYLGHVYVWPTSSVSRSLSMERIRSSIGNLKCGWTNKISLKLLSAVQQYAESRGFEYIVVNSPIGPMPAILKSLGFLGKPRRLHVITTSQLKKALADQTPVELINPNKCDYPYKELDRLVEERKIFPNVEPELARLVLYRHPLYFANMEDPEKQEFADIWKTQINPADIFYPRYFGNEWQSQLQ